MRSIVLTRGMTATVDDEDYEYLMQWRWRLNPRSKYAIADIWSNGKRTTCYMHRLVAERKGLNLDLTVDHWNRRRCDNRRSNLRSATHHQQRGNTGLRSDNSSGYRGFAGNHESKSGKR